MAKLKADHKRLIVQRLATFVTPTEIITELKELGVVASIEQVRHYDATSNNRDLGEEWKLLHAQTRAAFVKDTAAIAVSHRSFRIQELGDMYRRAKLKGNLVLAADLLERAAKEMGEAYTNKKVIEVPNPAAALAALLGVSADEVTAAVANVGASAP